MNCSKPVFTIAMVMMLVAVSSADLSVTDHLRGWIDGAAAQLGWGSNSASEAVTNHGRSLAAAGESDRALIINNASIPAWRGRFDTQFGLAYYAPALAVQTCKTGRATNCNGVASLPSLSYPYMQWMPDPTTNTSQPVMKVWYPAGSWSPTSSFPGGTLFYGYPYKDFPDAGPDPFSTVGASLEYEVYFPAGFNFVKGGKLPGFGGGNKNGKGCGGGVDPAVCFSYRIMWRRQGYGEAYLYVPHYMQAPDFCGNTTCGSNGPYPCTVCDYQAGVSFRRGSFQFQTGVWTKLRLFMMLNTPNVTNGLLQLYVNDQLAINYASMNWRQYPNIFIEGITFATWFGGSDQTWAPPTDTYTMFRNMKAYYMGPTDTPGRSAVVNRYKGPQVVVNEFIDEGV